MNKSQNKLIHIYLRLVDYFYSGVLSFVVLNTIREEYHKYQELADDIFIGTLVISTYNTGILTLANTIKPNSDSIHLSFLINCIKNSKNNYDAEVYNQLLSFIFEFETELKKISHITDRVINLRDTTVAHFDRKHVNNPSSLFQKPPIKWDDLELAYDIIFSGLIKIGVYLDVGTNIEPIIQISNYLLAQKTKQVFRQMYVSDKANFSC